MAVANSFVFDNVNTDDYGIIIEGSGDYSAPKRAVEAISIPGRDGDILLDQGHWENISITYRAAVVAETQAEFVRAVTEFRNAILSHRGYHRLTDTYHPGEYRLAAYEEGFNEEPEFHGRLAIFDITFNCKPQRFLMSGETPIEITSGTGLELANPTPFDASPLIETEGHGQIDINGKFIELTNQSVGTIELNPAGSRTANFGNRRQWSWLQPADDVAYSLTDNGDTITFQGFTIALTLRAASNATLNSFTTAFASSHGIANFITATSEQVDSRTRTRTLSYGAQTWTKGSGRIQLEDSIKATYSYTLSGGSPQTVEKTFKLRVTYSTAGTLSIGVYEFMNVISSSIEVNTDSVIAESTQSVLGSPTYIDCDLGMVYKIVADQLVSVDKYIDLGSDLPVLKPGQNSIVLSDQYGSTQSFKITPRWWVI